MKSRISKTVAIAALMASAAGAAQATEGWYGRADVGYSFDGEVDGTFDGGPFNGDLENDWMGALGMGYAWDNGFRTEIELGYRYNDWQGQIDDTDWEGHARSWSGLGNLFYDFNRDGDIQPYVGVGVGLAQVQLGADGFGRSDDKVLAYQAMVGAAFGVTEQLDLDVGLRYFTAPELEFSYSGTNVEADYTHTALTDRKSVV